MPVNALLASKYVCTCCSTCCSIWRTGSPHSNETADLLAVRSVILHIGTLVKAVLLCSSHSRHADIRYEQRQEVHVDLCAEIKLAVVSICASLSIKRRLAGLPDDHDHSQNFCSHLACCESAAQAQHPQRIAHQLCQRSHAVSRLA